MNARRWATGEEAIISFLVGVSGFFRLAIMKKGEIYCQDTIPRLKQKYGKGFTLLLKLKSTSEPVDEVDGVSSVSEELDSESENLLQVKEDDPKQVKDVMRHVVRLYKRNITLKDKHMVSNEGWMIYWY